MSLVKKSFSWLLLQAVKSGTDKKIKACLWMEANVNTQDASGATPLMLAVDRKRLSAVKILLEANADTTIQDNKGQNALHRAADKGYEEILGAILEKSKASIETFNLKGHTPLMTAVERGHISAAKTLLKSGADVNTVDANENTPLIRATETGYFQLTSVLLENGANPHARNKDGETAFLRTAENGYTNIIPLLLEKGVDINTKDKNGDTMMHRAARRGRTKLMAQLIERGGDVKAINAAGETPLHRTAENGHIEAAFFLVEKGVNPDVLDAKGETAFLRAAKAGLSGTVRALCSKTGHDFHDPQITAALKEAKRREQNKINSEDGLAADSSEIATSERGTWKKISDTEIARVRLLPASDLEQVEIFDFRGEVYTSHIGGFSGSGASQLKQRFAEVADQTTLAEAKRVFDEMKPVEKKLEDGAHPSQQALLPAPAPAASKNQP